MAKTSVAKGDPYHHGDLRQALVDAGLELAREGGPPAIVLREVARRIGVSPNAAYRHFTGLPELLSAVGEAAREVLARSMEAELAGCASTADAQADAVRRLKAVGRGYVHFALDEPGLFASAFSHRKASLDFSSAAAAPGVSPGELLGRALDSLVATGLLAAEDRGAAATTAWAAVHGLSELLLGPLQGIPQHARDPVIDATLDLVGRGITGDSHGTSYGSGRRPAP